MANVVSIERLNERDRVDRLDNGASILVQQEGQNYFDRDTGKWEQSDNNIYPDDLVPGFTHNAKAGRGRVRLAKGGRFRVGLRHPLYVTYSPRGANVIAPTVAGNKAQYKGLWPKTDVDIVKFPEGVKETLVLADASAPSSYVWDLEEIAGVVPTLSVDGGLDYVETLTGAIVGRIPAPTVHDAAGVAGTATMTYAAGAITIAIDPVWLADPARVFPVMLDPTTLVVQPDAVGKDAFVWQGGATTNYGTNATLYIGDTATASQAYRSYLQPDLSGIPSDRAVLSAQLELYRDGYGSSTNTLDANLYRVTATWDEATITWNAQPAFDTTIQSSVTGITLTTGWVAWTGLGTLVQNWHTGTWANYGAVVRKATDGTTNSDYKRFISSDDTASPTLRPKWTITYTEPPTVTITSPNGTQTTPTTLNDEITPSLSGVYNSVDSQSMAYRQHRIYDELNNLLWDSAKTAATATAGSTVTVTLPVSAGLKYGTKYKWRWMAWDVNGAPSAWSADGWFQFVLTSPTGLTASADAINARMNLTWTAHAGENLAGYNLYRKLQGAADADYKKVNLSLLTGTSTTDDTAASGQGYTYALTAVASDGYESVKSAGVNGTVSYTGAWIDGIQVDLRDLPRFARDRRASERLALDGTWQIQDQGFAPPKVQLAVRYASAQERDSIMAVFPADTAVTYRDEQGNVLRGKITSSVDDERIYTAKSFHGVLRFTLTEVTA